MKDKALLAQIDKKLENIGQLLKYLLALKLYEGGMPKAEIAKRVNTRLATISDMLKNVKRQE